MERKRGKRHPSKILGSVSDKRDGKSQKSGVGWVKSQSRRGGGASGGPRVIKSNSKNGRRSIETGGFLTTVSRKKAQTAKKNHTNRTEGTPAEDQEKKLDPICQL